MGRRWRWLVGVVALAALEGAASASCVCKDVHDCSSALNCIDSIPGTDCSPPTNGSCHIVKGRPNDLACCCGCSRNNAAAVTACTAKYAAIDAALALVEAGPAGGLCAVAAVVGRGVAPPNPADPVVKKGEKPILKKLNGARNQCEKQNANGEAKAQNGANAAADKLKKKLRKMEQNGRLGAGCADAYGNLIDEFTTTDQPGASTTTTTGSATTTTTLVSGPVVISTGFGGFGAGTKICLERFGGSYCLFAGGSCGVLHVHANPGPITIDGTGSYTDPQTTGQHCGYGEVKADEPGCHPLATYPPECP